MRSWVLSRWYPHVLAVLSRRGKASEAQFPRAGAGQLDADFRRCGKHLSCLLALAQQLDERLRLRADKGFSDAGDRFVKMGLERSQTVVLMTIRLLIYENRQ